MKQVFYIKWVKPIQIIPPLPPRPGWSTWSTSSLPQLSKQLLCPSAAQSKNLGAIFDSTHSCTSTSHPSASPADIYSFPKFIYWVLDMYQIRSKTSLLPFLPFLSITALSPSRNFLNRLLWEFSLVFGYFHMLRSPFSSQLLEQYPALHKFIVDEWRWIGPSPIFGLLWSFPGLPQNLGSLIHPPPLRVLSPNATDPGIKRTLSVPVTMEQCDERCIQVWGLQCLSEASVHPTCAVVSRESCCEASEGCVVPLLFLRHFRGLLCITVVSLCPHVSLQGRIWPCCSGQVCLPSLTFTEQWQALSRVLYMFFLMWSSQTLWSRHC